MGTYVVDIETDGLHDTVTKVHCLTYHDLSLDSSVEPVTLYSTSDMCTFLAKDNTTIIGHDFMRYDKRLRHGLGEYGEEYGIPKPVIDDWSSLTPEEYGYRCAEDVKINTKLWLSLEAKLDRIYYKDCTGKNKVVDYLTRKMGMASKQEELQWDLDVDGATKLRDTLAKLKDEKREALASAMPLNIVYAEKSKPKVFHKANGDLSAHGIRWLDFLKEQGLASDTSGPVKYITDKLVANPDSALC